MKRTENVMSKNMKKVTFYTYIYIKKSTVNVMFPLFSYLHCITSMVMMEINPPAAVILFRIILYHISFYS